MQRTPLHLIPKGKEYASTANESLRIENLTYERNDEIILRNLSFIVKPGEILQILGSNGSGKSTLLRLIADLLSPTTGIIHLPENSIFTPLYLGHSHGHRGMLTPFENLALFQTLHGIKVNIESIQTVLHSLALPASGTRLCNQLSAGQQRRVALARLQLVPAQLWILDEPTTALDEDGQQLLEQWISKHLGNSGMVVMATHMEIVTHSGTGRTLILSKTRD